MRTGLLVVAAAALAVAARMWFGATIRRAARTTVPFNGSLDANVLIDDRFSRMLLVAPLPLILFSLVALAILQRSATYGEAIIGLLLASIAMSLVLPALSGELVLWSHGVQRMPHDEEMWLLSGVHRLNLNVREVWVSHFPIVTFWRASLFTPSLVVGRRLVIWSGARGLAPARLGGFALASAPALFWPYAVWPLVAAVGFRLYDPTSLVPWWMFALAAGLGAGPAASDLFASARIAGALRTDASAIEAIRGSITLGLLQAHLVAARGPGRFSRLVASSSWDRTLRRAAAMGRLAGVASIDALVTDAIADSVDLAAHARAADAEPGALLLQ